MGDRNGVHKPRGLYGLALGVVVLLMLGEVGAFAALRLHSILPWGSARVAVSKDQQAAWAGTYARETKASGRFVYTPYVIWRHKPYQGRLITVEDDGLRRTTGSRCERATYVIWMFGGSALWGAGAPDAETIPSLLAGEYQRHGREVCVRNFGESAWVSSQELVELMLELARADRDPDLVIFYDGVNDVAVAWQFGTTDVHQNVDRIKRSVEASDQARRGSFRYLLETNTVGLLEQVRGEARARPSTGSHQRESEADRERLAAAIVDHYVRGARVVKGLASEYGFKYAFFWQPTLFTGRKPPTPEEEQVRLGERRRYPDLDALFPPTYARLRAAKLPQLVDLADVFDGQGDSLYIDFAHVSPEGNRLIAARMYEVLQRQRF